MGKALCKILEFTRLAIFSFAVAGSGSLFAQKAPANPPARLLLAINESSSADADASETLRYEEFSQIVGKALGSRLAIVVVRDRNLLKEALKRHTYALLLARPNDLPAEAIRDNGYQPVVVAKEPSRALFIVKKDSPLRSITDVRGRSIVTPDQYSNIWRMANAMLRDSKISMTSEKVRSMRDQGAIGWSMESGFFEVGVVGSTSAVGRTWEKNGGRVIARGPETPDMPLIAAPEISAAQMAKIRAALLALNSSESGQAVLKQLGLTGFAEASPQVFLDFLKWLGDLEIARQQ
jgi:ABC-type phosphate/phosphonate transport system substrate-binding protein